jgi:small-conductance mechanosensitive channel/CRP-like cAMP-binding protein
MTRGAPVSRMDDARKLGLQMSPWLVLVLFVLATQFAVTGKVSPEVAPDAPDPWIERALGTALILALARTVERLLFHVVRLRRRGGIGLSNIGLQILKVVIYFVAFAATVNLVFGQSIAAILAASGVAGIVIGFALRGLVSDVFSGVALNLDLSFRIGEMIDAMIRGQAVSGRIVEIQWRCTVLEDRFGNLVAVPNGELSLAVVTNRSRPTPLTEYSTNLPVPLEQPIAEILAMLDVALQRLVAKGTIAAVGAQVNIAAIETGNVVYRLRYQLDLSVASHSRVQSEILRAAQETLALGGVSLAARPLAVLPVPADPEALARVGRSSDPVASRSLAMGQVALLAPLSSGEIRTLAERATERHWRAGEVVFVQGAQGSTMLVVLAGTLDVLIDKDDGRVPVARLWPGDCVGEMSLLTGMPRSATVQARTAVRAVEIDRDCFRDILLANARLVEDLAAIVETRAGAIAAALAMREAAPASEAPHATIMGTIRRLFGL